MNLSTRPRTILAGLSHLPPEFAGMCFAEVYDSDFYLFYLNNINTVWCTYLYNKKYYLS